MGGAMRRGPAFVADFHAGCNGCEQSGRAKCVAAGQSDVQLPITRDSVQLTSKEGKRVLPRGPYHRDATLRAEYAPRKLTATRSPTSGRRDRGSAKRERHLQPTDSARDVVSLLDTSPRSTASDTLVSDLPV